jgi:hypothetical protein
MTNPIATTQKSSDRPAEFQVALDAYIRGYRRHHRNLPRPGTLTMASILRLIHSGRSWVLAQERLWP